MTLALTPLISLIAGILILVCRACWTTSWRFIWSWLAWLASSVLAISIWVF